MLIKPGPAISTLLIPALLNKSLSVNELTINCATVRGAKPDDFASASATEVA